MPPWTYAAQLFGLPKKVFTSPIVMMIWTEWAGIIKASEAALSDPNYFTHTEEAR